MTSAKTMNYFTLVRHAPEKDLEILAIATLLQKESKVIRQPMRTLKGRTMGPLSGAVKAINTRINQGDVPMYPLQYQV